MSSSSESETTPETPVTSSGESAPVATKVEEVQKAKRVPRAPRSKTPELSLDKKFDKLSQIVHHEFKRMRHQISRCNEHLMESDGSSDSNSSDDEHEYGNRKKKSVKHVPKKVKTQTQPLFDEQKTGIWAYGIDNKFRVYSLDHATIENTFQHEKDPESKKSTKELRKGPDGKPVVKAVRFMFNFPVTKVVKDASGVFVNVEATQRRCRFITEDQVRECIAAGVKCVPDLVLPREVKRALAAEQTAIQTAATAVTPAAADAVVA